MHNTNVNTSFTDPYKFDLILIFGIFSYIMATSFSGGRSQSTQREPQTMGMGKQLANFMTY